MDKHAVPEERRIRFTIECPASWRLDTLLTHCSKTCIYRNYLAEWTDYPGGTGAMAKALNENETDVAVILTEGIVKDIASVSQPAIF